MASKIIFLGDGGVGKTSLIRRYLGKGLSKGITLGVDFYSLHNGNADIVVWDLSGQERFRYLLDSFIVGARIAVLVFDLSRPSTMIRLEQWLGLLDKLNNQVKIILVGNKKDLGKRIDNEFIKQLINRIASKHRFLRYIETSAYSGENVDQLFELIRNIIRQDASNKEEKIRKIRAMI